VEAHWAVENFIGWQDYFQHLPKCWFETIADNLDS